ncbi:MAG: hypothetical protein DRO04_02110 [Candidatus Iainarchaeum archaeon]|uniref:V-type ATP synthase subunit F n=1 Tax=Candidatus Iainarchaeum sp. TaxID=3101447 RepID=A0A497JHT0_9ARCH|nr:MAG: hypothetical protein DRO04_02110 [Candidatus Diapherotrites archaeon]
MDSLIVIGNRKFAIGMKLAGIKRSFFMEDRKKILEIVKNNPKELIVTNVSIAEKVPELKEFKNVVIMPDDAKSFGSIDDLKELIKSVVGIEIEVV